MKENILEIISATFNKKENENKELTFYDIFENVKSELMELWLENNPKILSKEEIIKSKMGETYKLLTVDGRFLRLEDSNWVKIK